MTNQEKAARLIGQANELRVLADALDADAAMALGGR